MLDVKAQIEKAIAEAGAMQYDPVAFLKGRLDRNQAKVDAISAAERKLKAGNTIKDSTRTPGEALPVVKVRVRKIQMPEEA